MKLFLSFSCVIILIGSVVGTANNRQPHYISIDINRHRISPEHYIGTGTTSIQLALQQITSVPDRTNDSVALYKYLNDQFYGNILIGHPAQSFKVAFDTTWTISWVLSSECETVKQTGCLFHNRYAHEKSSEYIADGKDFTFNTGPFAMKGFYSRDNVTFAHVNVTDALFVEMTEVPKDYIFQKVDGVIGMGRKLDAYDPYFYKLLNQGKVRDPIFSIYLNRDPHSIRAGNIYLGMIEPRHIHHTVINGKPVPEKINYLKADDQYFYWQFTMDKFIMENINHKKGNNLILCKDSCKAIVDSSSNTIVGPIEEIEKIHKAINAKFLALGRYSVDCNTVNALPKVYFVLGGQNYTLKGSEYTVKMTWRAFSMCFSVFAPGSTIQENNRWILGGAFLAEYYSVYNVKSGLIGFVKAA